MELKRSDIDIDDILNSFEGIQRAEARPFMYTRIKATLEEEKTFLQQAVNFFAKPVIAFGCIATVLAINVYTVIQSDYEHPDTTAAASTSTNSPIADVLQNENYILAANEYNQ